MALPKYSCLHCNRIFSIEEYTQNHFCPDCCKFLSPNSIKKQEAKENFIEITPIKLNQEQIKIKNLFSEFKRLKKFQVGENITFQTINDRKTA